MSELDLIQNKIKKIVLEFEGIIPPPIYNVNAYYSGTRVIVNINPRITFGCEDVKCEDEIIKHFKSRISEEFPEYEIIEVYEGELETTVILNKP